MKYPNYKERSKTYFALSDTIHSDDTVKLYGTYLKDP